MGVPLVDAFMFTIIRRVFYQKNHHLKGDKKHLTPSFYSNLVASLLQSETDRIVLLEYLWYIRIAFLFIGKSRSKVFAILMWLLQLQEAHYSFYIRLQTKIRKMKNSLRDILRLLTSTAVD